MAVLDTIAKQANRLATDVQVSLKRARVEGERRLLQRQHRTALEELGERAYELVRAGVIPEDPLAPEIAAVESKLMEIEAKVAEIDGLRGDGRGRVPAARGPLPHGVPDGRREPGRRGGERVAVGRPGSGLGGGGALLPQGRLTPPNGRYRHGPGVLRAQDPGVCSRHGRGPCAPK